MIVIHYPTAFKALNKFIEAYNSRVVDRRSKIKSGAVLAAKELVRIYGISLLKSNIGEVDLQQLPSLKTNNRQLAALVKCSTRTIQRYLAKLQQAGMITSKVFHGSNSGYELWFRMDILLAKTKEPVYKCQAAVRRIMAEAISNDLNPSFSPSTATNCPDTYSGNKSYTNNIIMNRELVNKPIATSYGTGNRTGNTREIDPTLVAETNSEKQVTGACGGTMEEAREIDSRVGPPVLHRTDPAREQFLNLNSSLLWMMTRNLLYKSQYLTQRQILIGKRLIRRLYENEPTETLARLHQEFVERIALVDKYVRRDPRKRYVPLPYKFFDPDNVYGFAATKAWYQAYLVHRRQTECEMILSRVIRKYNQNRMTATSHQKPPLQLFRECETTLGKLNNPSLLDRFYAAVLNPDTYQLIKPQTSC